MDHLLCPVPNEKALLQMNKVLPKGSLQRPFLSLAWCHDQFNTQTACPTLLTHSVMAFLVQASFKLHFIAVVFVVVDSFLQHLSLNVPKCLLSIYLSIYLWDLLTLCIIVKHHQIFSQKQRKKIELKVKSNITPGSLIYLLRKRINRCTSVGVRKPGGLAAFGRIERTRFSD